jgi:hypothetical protein
MHNIYTPLSELSPQSTELNNDSNPTVLPCDWDNVTPLPSHVNILGILHTISNNPLNSLETKDMYMKLRMDRVDISSNGILYKFVSNVWMELEKIIVKLLSNYPTSTPSC